MFSLNKHVASKLLLSLEKELTYSDLQILSPDSKIFLIKSKKSKL